MDDHVEVSGGDRTQEIMAAWRRERPEVDVESIAVITPLWRVAAVVMANRERTLATYGLDHSTLDVLGTLRRSGPPYRLTATQLSRRCHVTPGATTQRVARLEARGFVERVREDPDRRTVYVVLTSTGLSQLDDVFEGVMRSDESMLDGLPAADRTALVRILGAWEKRLPPAQ